MTFLTKSSVLAVTFTATQTTGIAARYTNCTFQAIIQVVRAHYYIFIILISFLKICSHPPSLLY